MVDMANFVQSDVNLTSSLLSTSTTLTTSFASWQRPVIELPPMIEMLTSPLNFGSTLYKWIESYADPRVANWPLMSSPVPTVVLVVLYLTFVKYGPKLMQKRAPFQLRWPLVIYNLSISMLNLWMLCELVYCAYKLNYGIPCQLMTINDDPYELRIANVIWWYYFSKLIEFCDTIFFILRKKHNQLTFLHVYHHSSMFLVQWIAARFVPGGSSITPTMCNCCVHVVMYLYYGLAAMGERYRRYLWWKRYMTVMQLVQFMIGIGFAVHMITTGCQFVPWMQKLFGAYTASFMFLFGQYYLQEYHHKANKTPISKSQ